MEKHNNALVSVIITTFHNETYLPRAIESVLHQSYSNIELIVVDDNPPDSDARQKTETVMKKYPQAIYLRHPENRNGSAARNTGIRHASGKYIAFLDNDDIYFSHHIAECVDALESHPECKCVLCGVVKIQQGLCWDFIHPITKEPAKTLLFQETALGTGSNLFVEAEAVRAINGFDERFIRHQDIEFGIRLFSRYPVYSIDSAHIVKEMDGFSNVPNFERILKIKQFFWHTFNKEISHLNEDEQKRYYAGQYNSLLYTACKSGDSQHILQMVAALKKYSTLSLKNRCLVTLSKLKLFSVYEFLKKELKQIKSPKLHEEVANTLMPYDIRILNQALSSNRNEAAL